MSLRVGVELYRQPSNSRYGYDRIDVYRSLSGSAGLKRGYFLRMACLTLLQPVGNVFNLSKCALKALGASGLFLVSPLLPHELSRQARCWTARYSAKLGFKIARLGVNALTAAPYAIGYLAGVAAPSIGLHVSRLERGQFRTGQQVQAAIENKLTDLSRRWRKQVPIDPARHADILPYFDLIPDFENQSDLFLEIFGIVEWAEYTCDQLNQAVLDGLDLARLVDLSSKGRIGYFAICIKRHSGQDLDKSLDVFKKLVQTAPNPTKVATELLQYWHFAKGCSSKEAVAYWFRIVKNDLRFFLDACQSRSIRKQIREAISKRELKAFLEFTNPDKSLLRGYLLEAYLETISGHQLKRELLNLSDEQRSQLFRSRGILGYYRMNEIINVMKKLKPEECRILYPFLPEKAFIHLFRGFSVHQIVSHAPYITHSQAKLLLNHRLVPRSEGLRKLRHHPRHGYDRGLLKSELHVFERLRDILKVRLKRSRSIDKVDRLILERRIHPIQIAIDSKARK